MGFNSVIFICNDAIGAIKRDPEGWWEEAWANLNESECMRGWTQDFGFKGHANGFSAVWNQHADMTGIIIVGQNMSQVVYQRYGSVGFHKADGQVVLLREWAAELGYELRKVSDDKIEKKLKQTKNEAKEFHSGEFGSRGVRGRFLTSLIGHLQSLMPHEPQCCDDPEFEKWGDVCGNCGEPQ